MPAFFAALALDSLPPERGFSLYPHVLGLDGMKSEAFCFADGAFMLE
jgi:hypothetical protein